MTENEEVEEILRLGREHPLEEGEARRLLHTIVKTMIAGAERRGDTKLLESLPRNEFEANAYVEGMIAHRKGDALVWLVGDWFLCYRCSMRAGQASVERRITPEKGLHYRCQGCGITLAGSPGQTEKLTPPPERAVFTIIELDKADHLGRTTYQVVKDLQAAGNLVLGD